MLPRKHRRLSALIAGLLIAALPAQTQACWLFNCFGHRNRTTFFAPAAVAAPVVAAPALAAAPACAPCAQQTVSYVPQTAFRPLVTTTPVTAMRPVTATDPCTGCPTTVMQPTTAYVQRTVMMPYTTYRPVVQTSLFAPAVAAPMAIAPACPTGACAPATTTYYQPAAAPAIAQPGCCAATPAPSTYGPLSSTTAPSLGTAPVYGPATNMSPRTFSNTSESPSDRQIESNNGNDGNNTGTGASTLKPIREAEEEAKADEIPLRLLDPQNRTTSIDARAYSPVAWNAGPARQAAKVQKLDDSGWQAAR